MDTLDLDLSFLPELHPKLLVLFCCCPHINVVLTSIEVACQLIPDWEHTLISIALCHSLDYHLIRPANFCLHYNPKFQNTILEFYPLAHDLLHLYSRAYPPWPSSSTDTSRPPDDGPEANPCHHQE